MELFILYLLFSIKLQTSPKNESLGKWNDLAAIIAAIVAYIIMKLIENS